MFFASQITLLFAYSFVCKICNQNLVYIIIYCIARNAREGLNVNVRSLFFRGLAQSYTKQKLFFNYLLGLLGLGVLSVMSQPTKLIQQIFIPAYGFVSVCVCEP